ncbi:hypothetical protein JKP88DRAFT_279963 [Tribonema minus]|uniref:Uncharacterized protein n=1 Tax=Tribonema minus TaxID=303371 RepID=A0A836CC22_9STRA|nr:hypothetical protein JKP88DRAFT_279963 [Tribonema minus]
MPGPQQTQQQQSQQPQPPRWECGGCSMCQGAPAAAAAVSSLCGIARAPLAMVGGVLLVVAIAGAALLALCFRVAVAPFSRAYARRLQCEYAAAPLLDAAALILPRAQVHMTGDLEVLRGPSPGYALLNTDDMENGGLLPWWALLVALRHVGIHGMAKVPLPASALGLPLAGWLLSLLEFPALDHGACIRNCMESFAEDSAATGDPYLFIVEHSAARYHAHKLGLSPCLHALRAAHPSVYDITQNLDVTVYDITVALQQKVMMMLNDDHKTQDSGDYHVHMRLSCHGAEEVLQNPHWLEERQAAAARARAHFARHGTLPVDSPRRAGGFQTSAAAVCFTADTRAPHRMEAGALALARLVLVPLVLPPLLLASLPLLLASLPLQGRDRDERTKSNHALLLVAVVVIMWHAMCR